MLNFSTGVTLRSNGDPTWYQPVLNAVWIFFSFHFKVHNHVSMCLIWLFYTKWHIHLHQNTTDYEWIHNPWHLQQDIWEVVSPFLSKVDQPVYLATPTMHDYISQNLSMLFLGFSFVLSITLSEKTYLVQLLLTITHFFGLNICQICSTKFRDSRFGPLTWNKRWTSLWITNKHESVHYGTLI